MSEPKANEFLIGGTVGVVKGRWQARDLHTVQTSEAAS